MASNLFLKLYSSSLLSPGLINYQHYGWRFWLDFLIANNKVTESWSKKAPIFLSAHLESADKDDCSG